MAAATVEEAVPTTVATAPPPPAKSRWEVQETTVRLQPAPLFWQKAEADEVLEAEPVPDPNAPPKKVWNRINLVDVAVTLVWAKATVMLWRYAIDNV